MLGDIRSFQIDGCLRSIGGRRDPGFKRKFSAGFEAWEKRVRETRDAAGGRSENSDDENEREARPDTVMIDQEGMGLGSLTRSFLSWSEAHSRCADHNVASPVPVAGISSKDRG